MSKRFSPASRFLGGLSGLVLVAASAVYAGPPLACHPFEICSAKSLPWTSPWSTTGNEGYDTHKLASDTVAILAADSNVLVHMETLRRATLYARKDPAAAKQLFNWLTAGTKVPEAGAPPALHYFDVGYLAEAYKQWLPSGQNPAVGIDGYALVKQAIQLRGNDPEMEFAAALITLRGPADEHREHAQKAMAGANADPLLARNLASQFLGEQGETVAEVLAKPPVAGGRQP